MEALIPIFLFMCVAAVMILRPISSKLGGLLEAMARERHAPHQVDTGEIARIRMLLENVAKRVELMEERLDFTERLLSTSRRTGVAGSLRSDPLARERESEYLHG
ncbi:MAG: hypothetical protein ACRDTT_34510 [Pseudonocardiaceae bacterium]